MPSADLERLAAMFRRYAELEFGGSSPRYERLALRLADRPGLAAPLLAAAPEHRRAILFFAAVQHVLRTVVPRHPLAAYLPTLGGRRPPDAGFTAALARRDLVVMVNEAPAAGAELFIGHRPAEAAAGPVAGLLTLVTWQDGQATVEVLGETGPHGRWLAWLPKRHDSAPAYTRSTA